MQINKWCLKIRMLQTLTVAICFGLSGCNSSEAPHFLQSKEMQCLQSDALSFKDPTSLKVVKNLGSRRGKIESMDPDRFWLLYAAKNSYGAYGTASMACKNDSTGWVRDEHNELIARLNVYNIVLDKITAQLEHCNLLFKDKSTKSEWGECTKKLRAKYGNPLLGDDIYRLYAEKITDEHLKSAKNLDDIAGYD